MSDINTYIQQSRQSGMTDEQIGKALSEKGWTIGQIENVLAGDKQSKSVFARRSLLCFFWSSYGKYRLIQLLPVVIFYVLLVVVIIIGMGWVLLTKIFGQ